MSVPFFSVPIGPWGYDPATGAPQRQYYPDATFFSFGPAPYTGTVANTMQGATSIPFVPLIFDESPNVWADCQLCAADASMGIRNVYNMWTI
jgi:hypothetical protein